MLSFKYKLPVLVISIICATQACKKGSVDFNRDDLVNPVSFFPAPPSKWITAQGQSYFSSGWVGDVMPYFENDSFHVFYLHDGDANGGYHPVHAFTTKDLVHYNYEGRMIPFGGDDDQDRAIGTGSIVKSGNTYYFFYTGHNDLHWNTGEPVEGVMYATSTDLVNWTKKTGFVLYSSVGDGYGANDFRDPYVFFNKDAGEYWMLVSAIHNGTPVISLYTSADLSSDNWTLRNPLYTADEPAYGVMECADLFKMGNYWYLIFSENGVNKTTHYRMSASINGPWVKPASDIFDGSFYYAAKTASNGTERYLFGWTYRKDGASDYGGKIWGGNLVTHQLIQNSDGTLSVRSPETITSMFIKDQSLVQDSSSNVSASANNYSLQANGFAGFGRINGQKKLTTVIKGLQTDMDAGFSFGYARPGSGDYYKLRFKNGVAYLLKVQGANEYIDCQVPFDFTPGADIAIEMLIDNTILTVNINGAINLTGRSYWLPNSKWGIYSTGNGVTFQELKLFSY